MDPISIAAASAGLAASCTTIIKTLYTWANEIKEVDNNVCQLLDEVSSLSTVLKSISDAASRVPRAIVAEVDPDNGLWTTINCTLHGIKTTLNKIRDLVSELEKPGLFGRGFLRKPTKQIRFDLRSDDINSYRNRIHSYNAAMASAFQMITLYLLINSNSTQDSVVGHLDELKMGLRRVELVLRDETMSRPALTGRQKDDDPQSLHRFVQVAERFHSNASTIVGNGARSTVWGGSIMGDPLTEAETSRIERWIPPPISEDSYGYDTDELDRNTDMATDSDNETEIELAERIEQLAVDSEKEGDHAKAERFYRSAIDRSQASRMSPTAITSMRIRLAYACMQQGKWEEGGDIILPMAFEKKVHDVMVYHAMHALAIVAKDYHDPNVPSTLDSAEQYCKRALWGKRKTLGKDHPSCWETLALLATICEAGSKMIEAEAHLSFIPGHSQRSFHPNPLVYLGYVIRTPGTCSGTMQGASIRSATSSSFETPVVQQAAGKPSTPTEARLFISIHFSPQGMEYTTVAYTSWGLDEEVSGVIKSWPGCPDDFEIPAAVPSVLYYDNDLNVVGWGHDVRKALEMPGINKVERFHMYLRGQPSAVNPQDFAPMPSGLDATRVTTDYLRKIGQVIYTELQKSLGFRFKRSYINWSLTVPECWLWCDERPLRNVMASVGYLQDDEDDGFCFIGESEASAYSLVKSGLLNPSRNDALIVVNCGRLIVDIGAYMITETSPFWLSKGTNLSMDRSGSLLVTMNFSNLTRGKIRWMGFQDPSELVEKIHAKCLDVFKCHIERGFRDDGQDWRIELGGILDEAGVKHDFMVFTNEELRGCFRPVVRHIFGKIIHVIEDVERSGVAVQKVLLTGPFTGSHYLVQEIKSGILEEFNLGVQASGDIASAAVGGAHLAKARFQTSANL